VSKAFLQSIADELALDLSGANNVRAELDRQEHTTVLTKGLFARAILLELNFSSNGTAAFPGWEALPEKKKSELVAFIDTELDDAMVIFHGEAQKAKRQAEGTSASLYVWPTTYTKGKTPYIKMVANYPVGNENQLEMYGRSAEFTSFSRVREVYRNTVNVLFSKISKEMLLYREQLKSRGNLSPEEQGFTSQRGTIGSGKNRAKLALEHIEGTSVGEVKASRADVKLQKLMATSGLSSSDQAGIIKEFGLEIFLTYKSEIDSTSLQVKVGAYRDNQARGANEEAKRINDRRNVIKRLEARIKKMDLSRFAGSDNRKEIEKKKIIKKFNKDLASKNLRKTTKANTIINLSSGQAEKKVKGKLKKTSTSVMFKKGTTKSYPISRGKKSNFSLQSLIPGINAKLGETIAKNMRTPGLQNKTGRFAASARVTDIMKTTKGYPSIGYTYDKNPYQIFEPGAGKAPWANSDRDPRKVIDRSIREIAGGMLAGRFFTRRL